MSQVGIYAPEPQTLEDLVTAAIGQIQVIDVCEAQPEILIQTTTETTKGFFKTPENTTVNVVYQVVYPDDLNLKPVKETRKPKSRGRPKKVKVAHPPPMEELPPTQKSKIQVVSKTRSGREVKFPKYIQNDFKKIDVDDKNEKDLDDCDIKVTDFVSYTDDDTQKDPPNNIIEPTQIVQTDLPQRKRRVLAHHYRCPKCKKAYLGRSKMLEHLRKNPSHGPMHQNDENNFEVWNYLVSITQKCSTDERGQKFCQELSNLLHNLLMLTNALFKKLGSAANEVKIDKVLGNAIGLSPGTYYFDDNNLYKDVTVLQLMTNSDFLNSLRAKTEDVESSEAFAKNKCNCGKKRNMIDELVLKSMQVSPESGTEVIAKKIDDIKLDNTNVGNEFFVPTDISLSNFSLNDYDMNTEFKSEDKKQEITINNIDIKVTPDFYPPNLSFTYPELQPLGDKPRSKTDKIKIQSNILICPANKRIASNQEKNHIMPELLSDNSVLMPISTLHNTVDELMLPVTSMPPGNILDNSSSSDEVMNVDQFVNERFRKITESDLEATSNGGSSLNLELPALELFQFHTT